MAVSAPAASRHSKYLLTKELGRTPSRRHLKTLLSLLKVVDVTQAVIASAIDLDWPDGEDAIVHDSARFAGIPAVVTRDQTGFTNASPKVYLPAELLAICRVR